VSRREDRTAQTAGLAEQGTSGYTSLPAGRPTGHWRCRLTARRSSK